MSDSVGVGIKKALKFTRTQADKAVTVGRFIATFQVVGEYNTEEGKEQISPNIKESKAAIDIDHKLPSTEFGSARWRIRVDARAASGAPLIASQEGRAPSLFLQLGWTQYKQDDPSTLSMIQTSAVEENRHPIWNEQLLYNNPPESDKPCIVYDIML